MSKIKIYYLCGKNPAIKPTSGDQITEISIMKCLAKYTDVYYNNQLIDVKKDDLGTTKTKIEYPDKEYDIYWIRNNDAILQQCTGYKVRCGSPYSDESYKFSDLIITYSDSWKNKLSQYNNKREPSDGLYPNKKIIMPKDIMTVYQSVEDRFYKRISDSERVKIRNTMVKGGSDFIIAHYGRVSNTCYPSHIINVFKRIQKMTNKKIHLIFQGTSAHFRENIKEENDNIIINTIGIPYEHIHKYIQSVDLITSNYTSATANWGGCMHILEAIASNVPIICGDFDVRKEQLGNDYPLFWNHKQTDKNIEDDMYLKIMELLENEDSIDEIKHYLDNISKRFHRDNISKYIYNNILSRQIYQYMKNQNVKIEENKHECTVTSLQNKSTPGIYINVYFGEHTYKIDIKMKDIFIDGILKLWIHKGDVYQTITEQTTYIFKPKKGTYKVGILFSGCKMNDKFTIECFDISII